MWSTYGATGVQGTAVLYEERSDVRHDEDENFGDNYFIIFNRDPLVRDQDEVYIYYATLMEYKMSPATVYILPPTLTNKES